ncbi:LuxR family transcriptional regulator [Kutzneria viridogrisea]
MAASPDWSTAVPVPKVRVPPLPRGLVGADRLRSTLPGLRSATAPPVTLVCGPAGCGKTTLVTWCATQSGELPVAWADLEPEDNDPTTLRTTLRSALARIAPGIDRTTPSTGGGSTRFAGELAEVFEHLQSGCVLVLDNLHELRAPEALRCLDALVRRLPPQLRLVLVSRREPELGLSRLRLAGAVREVCAKDLVLGRTEIRALLAEHGVTPSPHVLDAVTAKTEGWPTGVRLAARALTGSADPAGVLAHLATDRVLGDYLTGEVLRDLPEDLVRFLSLTSVCDRFCAELAQALTGRADAAAVIGLLERRDLLLTPCGADGQWVRCPELLRLHLRTALRRSEPVRARGLHRLATGWLVRHGDMPAALRHVAAGQDEELAARLIEARGPTLLACGEARGLRLLGDRLPQGLVARPRVALVLALADLAEGDAPGADARLAAAPQHLVDRDEGACVLRAVAEIRRARFGGTPTTALATLLETRPERLRDPDLVLVARTGVGLAQLNLGHERAAEHTLTGVLHAASAAGRDQIALECLTRLALASPGRGDYARMRERAVAALRFAAERGLTDSHSSACARVAAAWAAHQTLDPMVGHHLSPVMAQLLAGPVEPAVELAARALALVLAVEQGRQPLRALAALHARFACLTRDVPVPPALIAAGSTIAVGAALSLGETARAVAAVQQARVRLGDNGDVRVLRAMVHKQRGRARDVRAVLRAVTCGEVPVHVVESAVRAHLMFAVLEEENGVRGGARRSLEAALELAGRSHALRPFVDTGAATRQLLAANLGRLGSLDPLAEDLLARIPAHPASGLPEGLTPRERALLEELPSMRTTGEIARDLFVSVNTVKTHLRSVYRKLGVSSRRAAVVAARSRGLL